MPLLRTLLILLFSLAGSFATASTLAAADSFAVDYFDANGDVFGGTCTITGPGGSVTGTINIAGAGTNVSGPSGTVFCAGQLPYTGTRQSRSGCS